MYYNTFLIFEFVQKILDGLLNGFKKPLFGFVSIVKEFITYMTGSGVYDQLNQYLDVQNSSIYGNTWSYVTNAYNAMAIVGMGLVILFWFLQIVDMSTKNTLTGHEFIRAGISLIVSFALVSEGIKLFEGLLAVSTDLINTGMSAFGGSGTSADMVDSVFLEITGVSINEVMNVSEWGEALGYLLLLTGVCIKIIIPAFISLLISTFCIASLIARALQLMIYTVFAPVAMSDLFTGGFMNSSGMKFLKKYLAIGLQGGVIVIGITISRTLLINMAGSAFGSTLGSLIVNFVTLTIVMKAQSMANDFVGV